MGNTDELVNYSYQFLYRFIGIPNHRLGTNKEQKEKFLFEKELLRK
jgi:hypothetical protein